MLTYSRRLEFCERQEIRTGRHDPPELELGTADPGEESAPATALVLAALAF